MTENDLTEFRRLRDKRKGGTVTNSAAPSASAAAVAVKARLDAGKAMLAAAEAKVRAKQAAAALQPAARQPETKPAAPTAVPGLSPRDQRRAAAKSTLADQSDSQLQFVAGHRSATEADRSAARAELEARGWTCHASGTFSLSTVKKPRR